MNNMRVTLKTSIAYFLMMFCWASFLIVLFLYVAADFDVIKIIIGVIVITMLTGGLFGSFYLLCVTIVKFSLYRFFWLLALVGNLFYLTHEPKIVPLVVFFIIAVFSSVYYSKENQAMLKQ